MTCPHDPPTACCRRWLQALVVDAFLAPFAGTRPLTLTDRIEEEA